MSTVQTIPFCHLNPRVVGYRKPADPGSRGNGSSSLANSQKITTKEPDDTKRRDMPHCGLMANATSPFKLLRPGAAKVTSSNVSLKSV